ncbi:MAG: hypothetical protein HKN12_02040, partial [Gemmatimonadetes bacterium]|nr:hypothetical protein [Gemmatimonadota bacterium]
IQTWAGNGNPGFDGDGNKQLDTRFYWPMDVLVTDTDEAFVMDWNNHRIRRLEADNTFQTIVGTEFIGDGDFALGDRNPPGVPGTTVNLNHPTHMTQLQSGKFMQASWHTHKLRHWDPVTGLVYVICGAGAGYAGDGQAMDAARFNQPPYAIEAPNGDYYVMDQRNQRIRKIDFSGGTNVVTTVVGTGSKGFAGDGGSPSLAMMAQPDGGNPPPGGALVMDTQGRIYFSDVENNRVRRVDFNLDLIETVVGDGTAGFGGDGGPGTAASLNNPRDLEFGPDGRLYIADELNHRVRAWDPATGMVETVAGNGTQGYTGDGGPVLDATLYRPAGLDFDPTGYLYIADSYNHVIRRVNLEDN